MARNRDGRRTTKKDEEAKRLRPEDLAFLGDAARKQIEEQLATSEKATEAKPQDEVLSVDQSRKTVKRVKASDLGRMTLKEIAKSLGYGSVGGVSKLLEALISGSPIGSQVGITREVKQQQASLINMAEQVSNNTKLLAMMGDEQKRTTELLAVLLDEIKKLSGQQQDQKESWLKAITEGLAAAGLGTVVGGKGGFISKTLKAMGLGAAIGGGTAIAENLITGGGATTPSTNTTNSTTSNQQTGANATRINAPSATGIPVTGKTGSDDAVRSYLQAGGVSLDPKRDNWCAAFVNSTLKQSGIPGSNSMVANSFQSWGTAVKPEEVQKGDVVLETRGKGPGQTGGHVGIATGNIKDGKIEMIAGNSGQSSDPGQNAIMTYYVPINDQLMVRRATASREQAESAVTTAQQIAGSTNQPTSNVNQTESASPQAQDASASMVERPSMAGPSAAAAWLNQEIANRQPIQISTSYDSTADIGLDNPSQGSFDYQVDTGDPGPVEPDDARERYEKLFAEAA